MTKSPAQWAAVLGISQTDPNILELGEAEIPLGELAAILVPKPPHLFFFSSRYGDTYALVKQSCGQTSEIGRGRYLVIGVDHCRYGLTDNEEEFSFFDPSGGPFMELGDLLSEIAYGAPRVAIRRIEITDDQTYLVV